MIPQQVSERFCLSIGVSKAGMLLAGCPLIFVEFYPIFVLPGRTSGKELAPQLRRHKRHGFHP